MGILLCLAAYALWLYGGALLLSGNFGDGLGSIFTAMVFSWLGNAATSAR